MGRYLPLLFTALCIDFLKAVAYWICFGLGAGVEAIPVVGQLFGLITIPLGIALGIALSLCLSIMLGSVLLLYLLWEDMFYWRYVLGGGGVGIVPGLDILPGWTLMTALCIMRKLRETGELSGSPAGAVASLLAPGTSAGKLFAGIQNINQNSASRMAQLGYTSEEKVLRAQEQQQRRAASELKNVDGIRKRGATAQETTPKNVAEEVPATKPAYAL